MATRGSWFNRILTYFEDSTQERVLPVAPVVFYDYFLGNALATFKWGTRDKARRAEAVVADVPNGAVGLALDATNEIQLAGIDWADNRTFVLNQGLVFEARFRFWFCRRARLLRRLVCAAITTRRLIRWRN